MGYLSILIKFYVVADVNHTKTVQIDLYSPKEKLKIHIFSLPQWRVAGKLHTKTKYPN